MAEVGDVGTQWPVRLNLLGDDLPYARGPSERAPPGPGKIYCSTNSKAIPLYEGF